MKTTINHLTYQYCQQQKYICTNKENNHLLDLKFEHENKSISQGLKEGIVRKN